MNVIIKVMPPVFHDPTLATGADPAKYKMINLCLRDSMSAVKNDFEALTVILDQGALLLHFF